MNETTRLNAFLYVMAVMPKTVETAVVNEIDVMPGMSDITVERLRILGIHMQQKLETAQDKNPWNIEKENVTGKGKEKNLIEKRKLPRRTGVMEEDMERKK